MAGATERGYDSDWERLRSRKIRTNPLCEECERQGLVVPAQDVDHIVPFEGRADPKRLDWSNLQSLCRSCHNRKTHGARKGCDVDGLPLDGSHWWNQP